MEYLEKQLLMTEYSNVKSMLKDSLSSLIDFETELALIVSEQQKIEQEIESCCSRISLNLIELELIKDHSHLIDDIKDDIALEYHFIMILQDKYDNLKERSVITLSKIEEYKSIVQYYNKYDQELNMYLIIEECKIGICLLYGNRRVMYEQLPLLENSLKIARNGMDRLTEEMNQSRNELINISQIDNEIAVKTALHNMDTIRSNLQDAKNIIEHIMTEIRNVNNKIKKISVLINKQCQKRNQHKKRAKELSTERINLYNKLINMNIHVSIKC